MPDGEDEPGESPDFNPAATCYILEGHIRVGSLTFPAERRQ